MDPSETTQGASAAGAGSTGRDQPATGSGTAERATLTLAASPDKLAALLESGPVIENVVGPQSPQQIVDRYYDTSDRRFRRRGLCCRVRSCDGLYVQSICMERNDSPVIRRRLQWNTPLPSPEPRLDLVVDPALRERIGLLLPGGLESVFSVALRRRTRLLSLPRSGAESVIVELTDDFGHISSGGRSTSISEIGIEPIKGSTTSVYEFGLSLLEHVPLRVELRSIAHRGYALSDREPAQSVKPAQVDLLPEWPIDIAIERILKGCFEGWLANEEAAHDGRDPEGVHQMRVALRRLRSALIVFKSVLPEESRAWLANEARWIASGLGPARDWDVFQENVLAPVRAVRPADEDLERLGASVEVARHKAYADARRVIDSLRYARFVLTFASWLGRRGWNDPWRESAVAQLAETTRTFAQRELTRRLRKARKRGRHFDSLSPTELHELRIALKKFRYSVDFFGSMYSKKSYRRYRKALARLQDQLGHLNDIAGIESKTQWLVESCPEPDTRAPLAAGASLVTGWHLKEIQGVRAEASHDWRALMKAPPFWKGDRGAHGPAGGA
jgi:triphosphatase